MMLQSAARRAAPTHRNSKPYAFWGMIALLLLVTWLGVRSLNADALWYDEVWSLYYAGGAEYGPISVGETVSRVAAEVAQHEGNPPGYYVLLNLWGQAVGWTEFATRVLSLLGGLLAVACIYRLGYDITSSLSPASRSLVGLGAALAIGLSAFFIYYLHELRAYALVVTLAAFDLLIFWRIAHTRRKPGVWLQAGLVFGVAISLYIHYITAPILGLIGLYHLLFMPKNRHWWRIAALGVLGCILFLPWVTTLLNAAGRADYAHLVAMSTPEALAALLYVFSNGSVALLALLGIFALQARGVHGRLMRFLSLSGLAVAVVLSGVYPIVWHIRYLIMVWPLLALLVGSGVEALWRKKQLWPGWILGIWLCAGLWNTFDPAFNRALNGVTMPWREFRTQLQAHAQSEDLVVFHAADFDWYRQLEMDHYLSGLSLRYSLMERISGKQEADDYYDHVREYLGDAPRVWVGVDQTFAPNFRLGEFRRALAVDYVDCQAVIDVPDMRLDLFAHVPDDEDALPFQFGDDIRMQLLEPVSVSGNRVSIPTGWYHGENVPSDTYSVALHVIDSAGNLVAQADFGLPPDAYACHTAALTVPSGTYTLLAAVYQWQTGERLPGMNTQTGMAGDRISLESFTVH